MSHFSVAVFTDGKKSVEDLLERYCESVEDLAEDYIMFHDATEEIKKEYEEGMIEGIKIGDKYYSCYSQQARDCFDAGGTLKAGYVIEKVPIKVVYSSIEELAEEYFAYKYYEKEGAYGYYYNPDAKWDWYEEGGRFSGMLYSKLEEGYVDSAEMSDIDFERMTTDAKEELKQGYERMLTDYAEAVTRGDKRLVEYFRNMFVEYPTAEEYANRVGTFLTYAVVMPDGKWYEPGEMGWWGISTATESQKQTWNENYWNTFIEVAKKNNWCMTIIDCHI